MNGCSFQQVLKFYGKIWVGFCLNTGKRFQNSPPFERSACFYVTISRNLKRFQYFNFETDLIFFFQKTRVLFLR